MFSFALLRICFVSFVICMHFDGDTVNQSLNWSWFMGVCVCVYYGSVAAFILYSSYLIHWFGSWFNGLNSDNRIVSIKYKVECTQYAFNNKRNIHHQWIKKDIPKQQTANNKHRSGKYKEIEMKQNDDYAGE